MRSLSSLDREKPSSALNPTLGRPLDESRQHALELELGELEAVVGTPLRETAAYREGQQTSPIRVADESLARSHEKEEEFSTPGQVPSFEEMDLNKDGVISRQEWRASQNLSQQLVADLKKERDRSGARELLDEERLLQIRPLDDFYRPGGGSTGTRRWNGLDGSYESPGSTTHYREQNTVRFPSPNMGHHGGRSPMRSRETQAFLDLSENRADKERYWHLLGASDKESFSSDLLARVSRFDELEKTRASEAKAYRIANLTHRSPSPSQGRDPHPSRRGVTPPRRPDPSIGEYPAYPNYIENRVVTGLPPLGVASPKEKLAEKYMMGGLGELRAAHGRKITDGEEHDGEAITAGLGFTSGMLKNHEWKAGTFNAEPPAWAKEYN